MKKLSLFLIMITRIAYCNAGWTDIPYSAWPIFGWHYIRKPISTITHINTSDDDTIVTRKEKTKSKRIQKKLENFYTYFEEKEEYKKSKKRFFIGLVTGLTTGALFTFNHFYGNHESEKISISKIIGCCTGFVSAYSFTDSAYEYYKGKSYRKLLKYKKKIYKK